MQALSQQLAATGVFTTRQKVKLTLGELRLPFETSSSDGALRRLPAAFYGLTREGLVAEAFVATLREIIMEREEAFAKGLVPVPFLRDNIYGICQLAHRQRDTHEGDAWAAYQQVIRKFLQMKQYAPMDPNVDVTSLVKHHLQDL